VRIGPKITFDESFAGSRNNEIRGGGITCKCDPSIPGEQLDQCGPQVCGVGLISKGLHENALAAGSRAGTLKK
jgi:hypothetical protein